MTDPTYFDAEEFNGVTVICVKNADYFDRVAIHGLRDALVEFVQENTPDKLIVDFVNVKAISSETINVLLRAGREADAEALVLRAYERTREKLGRPIYPPPVATSCRPG